LTNGQLVVEYTMFLYDKRLKKPPFGADGKIDGYSIAEQIIAGIVLITLGASVAYSIEESRYHKKRG